MQGRHDGPGGRPATARTTDGRSEARMALERPVGDMSGTTHGGWLMLSHAAGHGGDEAVTDRPSTAGSET